MKMAGASSVAAPAVPNQYLFTGKEFQDELQIGWIDFGARMYDASIARWNGVDALAEKDFLKSISPFSYALDNPIINIDPDGNFPFKFFKKGDKIKIKRNSKKAGVIKVTEYKETRIPGLQINLSFEDEDSGLTDFRWVQTVHTNSPIGGQSTKKKATFNDPTPPDDSKPFFFTDEEVEENDNSPS